MRGTFHPFLVGDKINQVHILSSFPQRVVESFSTINCAAPCKSNPISLSDHPTITFEPVCVPGPQFIIFLFAVRALPSKQITCISYYERELAVTGIGYSASVPSAQPWERFEPTAGDTQ